MRQKASGKVRNTSQEPTIVPLVDVTLEQAILFSNRAAALFKNPNKRRDYLISHRCRLLFMAITQRATRAGPGPCPGDLR